jgi:MoaA/NifB/PqqE/SkfB family radical SAM enzyme
MAEQPLPLVTFYLTDRCNSRCVTCDYWRHGRKDATLASIERVLPDLRSLGTRVALLSGGEPLLNPEWPQIAGALRDAGLGLWLLTSGLSLAKHARRVAQTFESVTVSMDGTCARTYAAIRGLDAFDTVCAGVRAAVAHGANVGLRVTLQRSNYRELPRFVALAHELGASQVSFLAVDVGNAHAFARTDPVEPALALLASDLPVFAGLIDDLERDCRADFESRFIAESPARLRRLPEYFAALLGARPFPAVRCNAPEFSAVVTAAGDVAPCFFIPGPGVNTAQGLRPALADTRMLALRGTIAAGHRAECERCVCSMWRDPAHLATERFRLREAAHA